MKTKILFLITELRPAGAEKILFTLAQGLRGDFEIKVACLSAQRGAVGDWLTELGIPVFYVDMASKWQFWKFLKFYRYLKKEKFQLLHTHLFHANLLGRILGTWARIPAIISTVHIVERRFRPWHFWLESRTHSLIRYEVCVSQAVFDFMQQKTKIPVHKLKKIWNGIDLLPFQNAVQQVFSRQEILKHPKRWVLGSVGHLREQKGYRYLIEAMAILQARLPNQIDLILVGDGEERERLERDVCEKRLEHVVHFLGYRSDIPTCLRCLDLFVLPSIYEGFGLVVIEAMACQVPVLATEVDSLPELIQENETGFLVPPKNAQALADRIEELLEQPDLRQKVIKKASSWAEEFRPERMVEEYRALYYDILKL